MSTDFWQSVVSMFLRSNNRKKDRKDHRYFSIVENHRMASGKTVQRTVLYLGESTTNNKWHGASRCRCLMKSNKSLSLFPDDREIPADAVAR